MVMSIKSVAKQTRGRGRGNPKGVMFNTPKSNDGRHFLQLRIGKDVARDAGYLPSDKVEIYWEPKTREGWLKPDPTGISLVRGDQDTKNPSLLYRVTWSPKVPSIASKALVEDLTIKEGQILYFKFPKGTSFDELVELEGSAEEEEEAPPPATQSVKAIKKGRVDPRLYEEHKALVEREKRVSRTCNEPPFIMKDGKPWGRREGDKKGGKISRKN